MADNLHDLPLGAHHPAPNPLLDARARVIMMVQVERHRGRPSRWMDLDREPAVLLLAPLHGSIALRDQEHGERICRPGSILLLPVPMDADYQNRPADGRFRNCWAQISGSAIGELVDAVLAAHGPLIDLAEHPAARASFGEWFRLGLREPPAGPADLVARGLATLTNLCAPRALSGVVEGALAIIEAELGDPELTVGRLAAAVGCPTSTFSRRFHAAVGAPPYHYLLRRRLDRARELLFGDDPIADIGRRCGYRDAAHFVHSFKRDVGESPGRYRRRMFQEG